MHRSPFGARQGCAAIDGVAEYIEHSRQNHFAHGHLQRSARIPHRHAARESLRRRQGNPAHVVPILLREHFDDDPFFRSREQDRIDGRQMSIEPDIHDAAAHRDDDTGIPCLGFWLVPLVRGHGSRGVKFHQSSSWAFRIPRLLDAGNRTSCRHTHEWETSQFVPRAQAWIPYLNRPGDVSTGIPHPLRSGPNAVAPNAFAGLKVATAT